jgi:hypothetical protein
MTAPDYTCKSGLCHTAVIDGRDVICYCASCPTCKPLETHFVSRLATPAAAEHRRTQRAKGSFVRSDS